MGYYRFVPTFGLFPAEKALTTLIRKPIPGVQPPTTLNLEALPPHLSPGADQIPPPYTALCPISPLNFTDSRLFDVFRGYGPISSPHLQPNFGPNHQALGRR